ncbi:prepilin peptidase [Candidatus Woesearchaeota archaeon]|nr:prepilin peptidase [Candidatus Woesearchaeota archaeon]
MLQFTQLTQLAILSFLIAATVSDLKKREVPNYVNYGLVVVGFGLAILQSVVAADFRFLLFSISGAAVALAFAALMFYAGQWGGGDSKLLVGLGAILGLPLSLSAPFVSLESQLLSFFFNLVIISLFYALAFAVFLAFKHWKKFAAAFSRQARSNSLLRKIVLAMAALLLVAAAFLQDPLLRLGLATFTGALLFGLYASMLAKAVEQSCMLKLVSPLKLTEGDWIARDVIVNGRRICGPKDLGIEKRQISQLIALYKKKKVRAVLIKEGIPFAPTFLMAYSLTVFFGNVFFAVLR